MKLQNFFPKYPKIEERNFESIITSHTEFPRLENKEIIPKGGSGIMMQHQIDISRYLSSYTPYNEVLLFWDAGTGKTCGVVNIIEQIRKERIVPPYRGAFILVKSQQLIDNFRDQLIFYCTQGKYVPDMYEKLTEGEKARRINSKIKDFYSFGTFEKFTNDIKNIKDADLRLKYDNMIIVIDEVHNIREQMKKNENIYTQMFRFLHLLKNRKIILMSGTPMKDQPSEFASIMNLILPENEQMSVGDEFISEYFIESNGSYIIRESKKEELKQKLRGRISYLKNMETNVEKEFVTNSLTEQVVGLKHYSVYPNKMSKFQEKVFVQALARDMKNETGKKEGIYNNSNQASLFVFPDGSYGDKGFAKYLTKQSKKEGGQEFKFTKAFRDELIEDKIQKLRKFSSKYADVIEHIINNEGNTFVYCRLVKGSGLILFSKLLELFGFSKSNGTEKTEGKRYAIIVGEGTKKQIERIKNLFNSSKNRGGKYIQVLLGSPRVAEAFTFKNVLYTHILTPHWNFSDTYQAIARTYRLGSHTDLEKTGIIPKLQVFLHCTIGGNFTEKYSLDLKMLLYSEKKDIAIKYLERLIKESTFDCILFHERNIRKNAEDYSRDCDFGKCDYICDFEDNLEPNESNYNLLYSSSKFTEIAKDLQALFRKSNTLSLEFLSSSLPYSLFELVSVLYECKCKSVVFYNKYGEQAYINEDNNVIYLSTKIEQASRLSSYYDEYPQIKVVELFESIINSKFIKNIPQVIEKIHDLASYEYSSNLLRKLPLQVQEMIIETALIAERKNVKKETKFRSFILNFYSGYIDKQEEAWISTFLSDDGILRCLNLETNEWGDCNEELRAEIERKKEEEQKKLEQENVFGYYGIMQQKEKKFLIRDVREMEQVEHVDKRHRTRGRVCRSSNKEFLIEVAHKTHLPLTDAEFKKKSREELFRLLEKPKFKAIFKVFSEKEVASMKLEELRAIVFWCKIGKDDLCEMLRKHFNNQGILKVE